MYSFSERLDIKKGLHITRQLIVHIEYQKRGFPHMRLLVFLVRKIVADFAKHLLIIGLFWSFQRQSKTRRVED